MKNKKDIKWPDRMPNITAEEEGKLLTHY